MQQTLLLNMMEAAAVLGISNAKVSRLVADGSLASICIGSRRLIRRTDLEQFVRDLESVAHSELGKTT